MGGGGGEGPGRIGDIKHLVEKAKEALKDSDRVGKRNVFISFAYEDVKAVNLLRGQAKSENSPLEFNDWSVSEPIDSQRAEYIKQKISERISQSSATVVFISDKTGSSSWVAWEVEESIRQGKHVIGVYPKSARPAKLPPFVTRHRIDCVEWPKLAAKIAKLK